MLAQIITENGQKKIIPLTADAGAGNPVGSYLYLEKKSNPQGYLYCDGSTFDETKYPLLYDYLGSNVLPDWRELGAKGAEKNTTLIFDSTETDPSTGRAGTQSHDVFTQGEFKDDQFQTHAHQINVSNIRAYYTQTTAGAGPNLGGIQAASTTSNFRAEVLMKGRGGTVTRGKSRAVFVYIKATSGLSENAQDNVVAQLNEERSYSTSEVNTGKKWIDGKPIYRKVITSSTGIAHNTVLIENVDTVINAGGTQQYLDNEYYNFPWIMSVDNNIRWVLKNDNKIYTNVQISYTYKNVKWWFEYTKTTD